MSTATPDLAPIGVLVLRDERVESWHRVSYAVADGAGRVRHAAGAVDRPIFPRSAVKPLQALALVESGAARRFGVSEAELALACASHSGEACHVAAVTGWLARLGLDQSALACGAHAPLHAASAERLLAAGQAPDARAQQLLRQARRHADARLPPRRAARRLSSSQPSGAAPDRRDARRDGRASTPCRRRPSMAAACRPFRCRWRSWPARWPASAIRKGSSAARRAACEQIRAAMTAHPRLVAGSERACTAIMTAAPELIVKTGAEGVYAAALPESGARPRAQGRGWRRPRRAGGAARAARGARRLARATRARRSAEIARPAIRNHAGQVVGRIEPAPGWLDREPASRRSPRPARARVQRGLTRARRGMNRGLSSPQGRASTLASWPNISICSRSRCS